MAQIPVQEAPPTDAVATQEVHIHTKSGIDLSWKPLDVIAMGAALVAIILAIGIAVGKVLLDGTSSALILGLVGAGAVTAYVGRKPPAAEGKGLAGLFGKKEQS